MEQLSSIPNAALRGITLRHLRELRREIQTRCMNENWVRSVNEGKEEEEQHNINEGESASFVSSSYPSYETTTLQPNQVNFYDLNTNFIIPQTASSKCSFVELVSESPLQPKWFVSHWWGQSVFECIDSLEQHAFDRNIDCDTAYWIYIFARNEHDNDSHDSFDFDGINTEIVGGNFDLKHLPFFRALQLCTGVVSIVDRQSVVFTRVWCMFEIAIALQHVTIDNNSDSSAVAGSISTGVSRSSHRSLIQDSKGFRLVKRNKSNDELKKMMYDVYTTTTTATHASNGRTTFTSGAVGLTDGVAAADMYSQQFDGTLDTNDITPPSYYKGMKTVREANFPIKVCMDALSMITLENAQASVENDRIWILNAIASCDESNNKDDDLISTTVTTSTSNTPPASHASYTRINQLLRSKFAIVAYRRCLEEESKHLVEKIRAAIKVAPIESLHLSFHGTRQFKDEARIFTSSLPSTLKILDLKFTMQLFETSEEFAIGFGNLIHLESLKLDCSTCTLKSCTHLWQEISKLTNLRVLNLNFSYNQYMESVDGLGSAISHLQKLKVIRLNFSECSNLKSIEELKHGLSSFFHNHTRSPFLDVNFSSTDITEESVITFCKTFVGSTHRTQRIQFNFEPIIDLQSVKRIKDLQDAVGKSVDCNDGCKTCAIM